MDNNKANFFKVDFGRQQLNTEDGLKLNAKDFTFQTMTNIKKMFSEYGYETAFDRMDVSKLLGIQPCGASKLLPKMLNKGVIEPADGRGMYKFVKKD